MPIIDFNCKLYLFRPKCWNKTLINEYSRLWFNGDNYYLLDTHHYQKNGNYSVQLITIISNVYYSNIYYTINYDYKLYLVSL